MLSGEATNTNFIVFGLTRSGLKPTSYHTWVEHVNHYATDAVTHLWSRGFWAVTNIIFLMFITRLFWLNNFHKYKSLVLHRIDYYTNLVDINKYKYLKFYNSLIFILFSDDLTTGYQILSNVSKVPRFETIAMFMSKPEKKGNILNLIFVYLIYLEWCPIWRSRQTLSLDHSESYKD
jgi:hypothetical protein